MLVTFLRDFRGVATREQYYQAGETVNLESDAVRALLAEGAVAVVPVIEAAPEPEPEAVKPVKPAALKRTAAAKHKARD